VRSYHVLASSFADPADVVRFRRCKERGGSDQDCFKVGDNGEGWWGDDTTNWEPQCALPPETMIDEWGSVDAAHRKKVKVECSTTDENGNYCNHSVVCFVTDRMPHLAHITNGARIDLNPAACAALGLEPPVMHRVIWYRV
jgi:hypothetical protein